MGQLQATACPICGGPNDNRWTCSACTPEVNQLRDLIRNLQAWHSFLESREVEETLTSSTGVTWSIWDVDYLYSQRYRLPTQMRRAIEFFLYENLLEKVAAVRMGVSESNPIAMYATAGLTKLIAMSRDGELPGFQWEIAS